MNANQTDLHNLRITRNVMISWAAWQAAREKASEHGMSISRYIEMLILRDRDAASQKTQKTEDN